MHPQTLDVVRTRAETFGFDVIVDDADKVLDHQDVFGVLLQQVGTTGDVHDYSALIAELKARKVVVSVAADFMALVLLTAQVNRARTLFSVLHNALVSRWATVAHMRRSLPQKMNSNVPCWPYHRRFKRCRR